MQNPFHNGLSSGEDVQHAADGLSSGEAERHTADGLSSAEAEQRMTDGLSSGEAERQSADALSSTEAELHTVDGLNNAEAKQQTANGLSSTEAERQAAGGLSSAEAERQAAGGLSSAETEQHTANGLSSAEAERRMADGLGNQMPRSREGSLWDILSRNLFTLFNLLNVALAVLLMSVGSYRNMLFLGVVFSNVIIGTVQELRAKRTHDRLQLLSEGKITVLRDGQHVRLRPDQLVRDDVVILSRGEQVPADARVLEGFTRADESILTGESVTIPKGVGDSLYSGSFLAEGKVTALLTAVGPSSYMGKLQMEARKVKRADSQLMRDMKLIIRGVSIALLPVGGLLYWRQCAGLGLTHSEAVVKTVGSVIGMIPEGLILLATVSLAAGVVKLGRKQTLVNELYGIESLARTDVICMDKTGTLTGGKMDFDRCVPLNGAAESEISPCLRGLLGALEGDSSTAEALSAAYPPDKARKFLHKQAFSSESKFSAVVLEGLGTVVMGAPEKLLHGAALAQAQKLAAQGLRVLALLHKPCGAASALNDKGAACAQTDDGATCAPPDEGAACTLSDKGAASALNDEGAAFLSPNNVPDLQPIALLCLRDALRPQVKETVRYFGQQGVSLKVISGDSPLTVSRVAKDAGIPNAEQLIDLSAIAGEKDYAALSRDYTVFGRVSPQDKQGLVHAMQQAGHSVAMVGDGVNDIPALKAADCSIAMGGGSDAASRVAQMTLLSGDFDAVPQIVLEGRRVINNITRASSLFLVKNIYSMFISLALLGLPFAYPFAPIQLTLVSALTVGFPSFVLALQPSRERVEGNFIRNIIVRALPGGLCVGLLTLAIMALQAPLGYDSAAVSTLCTILAAYSGLVVLLLTCLPLNLLRGGLVALMAGTLLCTMLLFPKVFYLTPIVGKQWIVLVGLGILVIPMQLGLGWVIRRLRRKPAGASAIPGHPAV